MAENQETYKVRIDTEVTGAENVDLLNKTVSTSIGEFDNLNEAISKTQDTLGKLDPSSKEFKQLSGELQDLKDRLQDTEIASSRFTEALAAQPGIIGFVGQSLEGLRGTFKVFMANPIIAVVTAIAGAFLALRESLTRTEEGQEKLNKISEGFTKILNGLFAIIEPIAMQLADLVVGLFENEKVMDGLSKTVGVLTGVFTTLFGTLKSVAGFIIDTLVTNFKTLIAVAKGAGDVIAGVFTFDWDRITQGANAAFDAVKEGVKGTVDNVKELGQGIVDSAVDGFKAGEKSFKEGFKRLTEEEKANLEERQKLLEEAQKVQTESYLSLLDERDRAIYEREKKYQEELKQLKEAGITDFTDLEEAYNKDILEINRNYDEQITSEKIDALDTRFSEIESTTNAGYDDLIGIIDEKETLLLEQSIQKQKELLQNDKLTEEQRERIVQQGEVERSKIVLDAQNQRKGIRDKETQDILLGLDNRVQEIISRENINTQELLSIVDERERLLLENESLTENERTRIRQEADAERAAIVEEDVNRRLDAFAMEYESLALSFDARRELINQKEQELLADENLTEQQRTDLRRRFAEERAVIAEQETQVQQEKTMAITDLAGQLGSFLQEVAGESKGIAIAGLVIEKAAAVAQIITQTAIANAKAVAAFPLTGGLPWTAINTASAALSIASLIAATVKGINEIKSTDEKGGTTSSAGGGGAALPRPSAPTANAAPELTAAGIPQVGRTEEVNTSSQIAESITRAQEERPIKTYVVSQDVSTQQALDRRTNRAATFSGGS